MTVVFDNVGANARPRHPEKAHRPDTPVLKKPDWIRVKAPVSKGYVDTQAIVRANGLHTVCEEAGCPNIGECWDKKHATFMIMGDTCTRACAFCNVKTGLPVALDPAEPAHVAEATAKLGLKHVVDHLGRSRRSSRWRRRALRADIRRSARAARQPRSKCSRPISCARTARSQPWWRPSQTCSTTTSKPCLRNISRCGRVRAISPRCGSCKQREGHRLRHVHQVRDHGRTGRGAKRSAPADGRPARPPTSTS